MFPPRGGTVFRPIPRVCSALYPESERARSRARQLRCRARPHPAVAALAVPAPTHRLPRLMRDSLVHGLQSSINNCKGLAEFFLRDAERRICEEGIPPYQRVETLLAEELS